MTALSIVFLAINCQKYRRLSILLTYNKRAFYNLQTFTLALIFSPNNKEKKHIWCLTIILCTKDLIYTLTRNTWTSMSFTFNCWHTVFLSLIQFQHTFKTLWQTVICDAHIILIFFCCTTSFLFFCINGCESQCYR